MALNTLRCNHLTPLHFKELTVLKGSLARLLVNDRKLLGQL